MFDYRTFDCLPWVVNKWQNRRCLIVWQVLRHQKYVRTTELNNLKAANPFQSYSIRSIRAFLYICRVC